MTDTLTLYIEGTDTVFPTWIKYKIKPECIDLVLKLACGPKKKKVVTRCYIFEQEYYLLIIKGYDLSSMLL